MSSDNTIYILDPFGCVRAYSETCASNLSEKSSVQLLTTGFTKVRGPIDRGDRTINRFFLRLTAKVGMSLPATELKTGGSRRQVRLLTTGFPVTKFRGPIDHGNETFDKFFLRQIERLKQTVPATPAVALEALGLLEYVSDLFRLRRLRNSGAIFHWQWIPLPLLTIPLLKLFGVPIDILTAHDVLPHGQANRSTMGWVDQLALRMAKQVIFHSSRLEAEAITLAPFLKGKTRVIPHGLLFEGEGQTRSPSARRTVGVVGLIRDYKGLDGLLEAWGRLKLDPEKVTLKICGDCRLTSASKRALLEKLKWTPNVEWVFGYLREEAFKAELSNLDLLILPYTNCSQSGVALAALGLGIPLLVSDAGALPELLEGGQEKWIFSAGDVEALAQKLSAFLDLSAIQVEEYRAWIRERAQLYSKQVIVREHLRVYEAQESQAAKMTFREALQ